jgi:signal transduction histidine kinase/CheY-like chemotaxis protein
MRSWRNSFVTRWAALFALLIVAVVLVSGWLRDRASRAYFLQDQRRHLTHRLEIIRVRLRSAVDGIRKDILYLSQAPAFARLATAAEGPEREAARREAEIDFRGGLQVRPAYFQARLIGVADGGRELMRFDQVQGRIREVQELRQQGDSDYFRETVKLPAGRFCFSEIDLERASGHISEPHMPTLRASTPIYDAMGKLFGIVIVNVDVTSLFEELRTLAGPDVVLTLSNGQGDYLLHPDKTKCFGFDLGRRYNVFDEHPQLKQEERHSLFEDEPTELSLTDEFPFTWECEKSLILRLALPKAAILAPLRAQRAQNLAITLSLALLAGAVVILVTNILAKGLRQMAQAVEQYEPGKPLVNLPPDSPDEVGLLTRKFRDMAGKISEQMQNLREARQRAEAGVRAREEFLATMSHEIRTPMNAVLGMAHLLETEGNGPHQPERLRTLKFAGRHLMALLNNLLDRERIESGAIVLDQVDFDPSELLENLRLSLEPLASRKGLRFVVECAPNLPPRVAGDAVRLYQVLNNLVHNAIKFTPHGRVSVRAEAGKDGVIDFQVADTGPGLPERVLAGLDETPNRAGSEAERSPGTAATAGLGLRISRRLIHLLGGRLEANSRPDGTTLFFSIPLPVTASRASGRAPEEPPDLADYTGLVIEDVPSNQMVLGALLAKTGMLTETAESATGAMEKLGIRKYDFAFVDVQLPDANGAELAAVLNKGQPGLRVLAVTAQVSPEVRAACESAGVRAFVAKPIEPAELYEKLRRLTSPCLRAVEELFDEEQVKVTAYFERLMDEMQGWESEICALLKKPKAERLGRLHHRMKNALGQLELWKLDSSLAEWRQAIEAGDDKRENELGARCLRLLAGARQFTGANRLRTSSL